MRQPSPPVREQPGPAAGASSTHGWRDDWKGVVVAGIAGLFMAAIGAFGTDEAPPLVRYGYWIGLSVGGSLVGHALSHVFRRYGLMDDRPWVWGTLIVLAISVPFTLVVWLVSSLLFRGELHPGGLPHYFPPVLTVTAAMTALVILVHRRRAITHAAPAGAAPPRFLERLPLKLRGAEVWAVEAEDHYLRLHTSKGQDLILMRLSDAIAELEGIEGSQTHRSWWVARDAIVEAQRGDGRAVLTLKDGAKVPVSRAYARLLRGDGWF
jgi:hypothetical protein